MIEITGNEISELSDSDLRALVGLLCEAELREQGLPTAGVTWGGHQNAADGGIDVRIELQSSLSEDGFIPRGNTGFQVKKPDMPPSAIISEMRPNNVLRQVIKDLADVEGAYIIVSSQGTTADARLNERREAMRRALTDYPSSSSLKVDFYDRERIAGWVRSHPALVLWVRDRIGRPIQGWKAYGNWSNSPKGIEEKYIIDEHVRVFNSAKYQSEGSSAVDGINEIRRVLHVPGSSVRLVGLSGVGKTRIVQALFDEQIGERPLNQSQVFYTDLSDSPNPNPRSFAEGIIAQKIPAILVVDNCTPDLHRQLTSTCTASSSLVSLITVEYDVRDDYPEETEVFRLEPSSNHLIKKLISSRFAYISEVDCRTIADFAGGNARIAMALANTILRGENLGRLRDYDLFVRLFQQRNSANQDLLRTAEVCSLVYSFNTQTSEGNNDELKLLGSLIGLNVREIYSNIRELERRDLIQKRGIWRAVLPHAIANKLAGSALENVPIEDLLDVFVQQGSPRFLKSFSRRLSFLHESKEVLEISIRWLREDGLLGCVNKLDELQIAMLKNIAPISTELTLAAIERVGNQDDAVIFFSRDNRYYNEISRLLRSIAYDKNLFVRAVKLLSQFALSEKPKENINSIRSMLKSLFHLYLSGTHATVEQRLSIISDLIESNDENSIELARLLLSSALKAGSFQSYHEFEFGAHSRDYGYLPANRSDVKEWYSSFIKYTVSLATSDLPFAPRFKTLLAEKFRELWVKAGMYSELKVVAEIIGANGTWREGWLAIKMTARFHSKEMKPEILAQLNKLAVLVEPKSLAERAKLYALSNHRNSLDLIDVKYGEDDEGVKIDYVGIEDITRLLGEEVGENEEVLKEILLELLCNEGERLISFGEGLAAGVANPEGLWRTLMEQLSYLDESVRSFQLLRGVLRGISKIDINLVEQCLEMVVANEVLAPIYPWLQASVNINSRGLERLKQSLSLGISPVWQYVHLAYGGTHKSIPDNDLCELLKLIASKPDGVNIAIKILDMRLHGRDKEGKTSDIIALTGQYLVLQYDFFRNDIRADLMDYELANIISVCFVGYNAVESAKTLSNKIFNAVESYKVSPMDYNDVLKTLAITHPLVFINSLLGERDFTKRTRLEFSEEMDLLSVIGDDIIITWCEEESKARYPAVALAIRPYRRIESNGSLEWTPLALEILAKADNPIEILEQFKLSFRPMSWSGSLADIMQQCFGLISDLKRYDNVSIVKWAKEEEVRLEQEIRSQREWELKRESRINETFE
ncbi:hypothetical protein IBT50_15760 [Bacillus sp. S70]|uniref:hypothetical protein n=1 Tax=unclassified Bacillus (in: firmicutes) TaxID=185979 RepID=UPI00190D5270|nr:MULTISPECIES: hypothetical protein [unclassified Bacillus (in: firmicutes)]MBJ9983022.1 hypothetical protein [Bacillus sp. S29]MBK0102817.1 hypothetical protein [Bacillus sp. S70]MBK0108130.1 hypothetical protein [Bacillus sp. S73]MBK0137415.1 hypothetical protein [Bacillus sp. S72]MBK0150449.1 hypothetical protein [Bacillus sp. S74]